jgi:predicted aminopeptidase
LALFPLLNGCYLLKQGTYLLSYNARARPVEKVLAQGSINWDEEAMLRLAQEIRRYAEQEIGLVQNNNYTRYLELDRDYLADVVTACAADSFTPHEWRFPIFGAFPYKGFYERADAEREASRLESRGLDVWIRKVDGFSTLGFFSDPIYNFMIDYSPFTLADLIIHEQAHATIFIKNEIQFNEELATFVGREGALAFLRDRFGIDSDAYRAALVSIQDWSRYRDRIFELVVDLEDLYDSGADRESILADKRRIIEAFNTRLVSDSQELFRSERFRNMKGVPVNNAYIMSFVRYSQDLQLFYRLYEVNGNDLKATVAALKSLEQQEDPPKVVLERMIAE